MKRRSVVEYAEASPQVRAIYDEVKKVIGAPNVPNFLKALGVNENVLRATWAKLRYAVLAGEVPMLLKQLILFNISVRAVTTTAPLSMDMPRSSSTKHSPARI